MAREPNTDHFVKLLHYQQRDGELRSRSLSAFNKEVEAEITRQKMEIHCDNKRLRNEISIRVKAKLQEYENTVEERRVK